MSESPEYQYLSEKQLARVEALKVAAPILGRRSDGVFKGSEPVDPGSLADVAEYILSGLHPMDRYNEDGDR